MSAAIACRGDKGGSNSTEPTSNSTLPVRGAGTGNGSVTSAPTGISCSIAGGNASSTGCTATYTPGTTVTLTATPTSGSTFTGWFGACSGTRTCQVTISAGTRVTAFFTAPGPSFGLSVLGVGTGSGSVISNDAGLICTITNGSAAAAGCAAIYASGATVTLTAAAANGSTFAGWSGACSGSSTCQVAMTQARSVTAAFTAGASPVLIVTSIGTGSGTVVSSPAGLNCTVSSTAATGSCNRGFAFGTAVTLTATQTNGSTFVGWGGACSGTGQCQVTLDRSRSVTINFTAPVQSAAR